MSLQLGDTAAKTHRQLFSDFYADLLKEPLEEVLAVSPRPTASVQLFQRMMHDIMTGGQTTDPIDQVCFAWIAKLIFA